MACIPNSCVPIASCGRSYLINKRYERLLYRVRESLHRWPLRRDFWHGLGGREIRRCERRSENAAVGRSNDASGCDVPPQSRTFRRLTVRLEGRGRAVDLGTGASGAWIEPSDSCRRSFRGCGRNGIEHRLTKVKHPWINRQVE